MKPYLGLYYKRNQVVEAIARILQRGSTKLDSDLYSRVKRLLELDRARGRNRRSRDPERISLSIVLICRDGGTKIGSPNLNASRSLRACDSWRMGGRKALRSLSCGAFGLNWKNIMRFFSGKDRRFFLISNSFWPALGPVIWPSITSTLYLS
jgi:hypothetical protein